jgi:hypothetical protein
MITHYDWTAADYEAHFGMEDDTNEIDALLYPVDHCERCDDWSECYDGLCASCSWQMHETIEGCL